MAATLVLVAVGILASLLPGVPDVEVELEVMLGGVLPPLLYASAVSMPSMDLRREFGTISGLSVVLVVVELPGARAVLRLGGARASAWRGASPSARSSARPTRSRRPS